MALALAAVAVAVYWPMLGADFVYDSRLQVLVDDYIHQVRNLPEVLTGRVLARDVLDCNRPTNLLSLMVDSMLWGKKPAGYHLTNLVLHAGNVVLLYGWLRRLTGSRGGGWRAAAGALLFALHPINSEAVCEVGYREDLLVTFFILVGLLAAERFPAGCVVALLLAVGAKENGIAGPPLLLLYWLLFHRGQSPRRWLVLSGVSFLIVTVFLVARFVLQPATSIIFTDRPVYPGGTFFTALTIQPRIWALYLGNCVWPANLCADYTPYSLRHLPLGFSLACLAVVLAGFVYATRRNRLTLLGASLFWLALLPVSNLLPIYQPAADRYLYLAMAGLCAWVATLIPTRWPAVTAGLWLVLCGALLPVTLNRERVWHNEFSLWSDTAARNPGSVTAAKHLAAAFLDQRQTKAAVAEWHRAVRLTNNRDAEAWAGLAVALEASGRPAEADQAYRQAIIHDPRYAQPEQLLAALCSEPKEVDRLRPLAIRNRQNP